ncbi:MAG: hypothetical protein A3H06_00815 [Candidatus Colwellbacteria bacterium RIFCSPLOWO2_12_FULL_44_13]|uniref:ABC transporter substrate-binding protein n=3 Tax=Candidatus Colwelliibacteriota TaxID=1817904 RepID=A0A1G1Z5S0_9BACT|nr:MAG: hypothetical protein A3F24_00065 [Candidatus Colwellbacteria bacterium RIFCSPHIGHO2_12_FULL_44_17]OGY59789.1 MAG: hypothetical protein A3I31_01120 [Candidatus Colwellbacteria bacterium RIFCSPLOWO2_02_FULL_44_20b]OGY61395.1 MAG: hypothetical protein A3H06_00815 [Candidatus Colwellbacteria bacterium RIFCSPLOWO2_12_FULL_44_13]
MSLKKYSNGFTHNQLIILGGAGIIVVFFILVFLGVLPGGRDPAAERAQLTFWGVFDTRSTWDDLISDYIEEHPGVSITYRELSSSAYENDLINALAIDEGPDIFMIQNSWLPRYTNKVVPLTAQAFPPSRLDVLYPEVVASDFVYNGQVHALPLSVDTLALYYNKDTFNNKQIVFPPKTWDEFKLYATRVREFGAGGVLSKTGAAIGGTPKSVNRATDIVGLLMMQYGATMSDVSRGQATFDSDVGLSGLNFYTQFSSPRGLYYTWNDSMGNSVDEFVSQRAAMMINYSYQIENLQAKNPFLNFGIAPVPQRAGAARAINYANYWGLTVSAKSTNSAAAWDFIKFVTTSEAGAEKYLQLTKRPPALRILLQKYQNDPLLGAFIQQALTAQSWYQGDNAATERALTNMLELVIGGKLKAQDALRRAEDEVTLIISRL